MQRVFPRRNRSREPLLRRLDRAAGQINPLLMVIAIGLAILNISCLITLLDSGALKAHLRLPEQQVSAPAAGAATR
jgi:hypothetical protein